jgi:hypothetical protein
VLALNDLALVRDEELTRSARARHQQQPPEWRSAEAYQNYGLRVTASELRELVQEIDRLVRPYIGATRTDAPEGADVAEVRLLAFRHPQSP